jgi:hypothetical protein
MTEEEKILQAVTAWGKSEEGKRAIKEGFDEIIEEADQERRTEQRQKTHRRHRCTCWDCWRRMRVTI